MWGAQFHAISYGLFVSPQKVYVDTLTPMVMVVRSGAFERELDLDEVMSVVMSSFSLPCEHTARWQLCASQEEGPHRESNHVATVILNFQSPEM